MVNNKFRSKTHPCILSHFCSEESHPLKYFQLAIGTTNRLGKGYPIKGDSDECIFSLSRVGEHKMIQCTTRGEKGDNIRHLSVYQGRESAQSGVILVVADKWFPAKIAVHNWGAKWVLRKPWSTTASKICKDKVPISTSRVSITGGAEAMLKEHESIGSVISLQQLSSQSINDRGGVVEQLIASSQPIAWRCPAEFLIHLQRVRCKW